MPSAAPARMDHVGLNVRDLDAMADWYVRAFGYRVQSRFTLAELDLRIVMLVDDDGRRFEVLSRSGGAPGLRAGTPVDAAATWGFGHVAFSVPDLAEAHARLLALGASDVFGPQPSPQAGSWFAYLHDPEGNLVELIGAAPA